jgi:HEAT repeat protein
VIAILALLALQADVKADGWTETRFHRVHLRNGNFVDGDLLRNDAETVTIKVRTGDLEVSRDLVERVELVRMRSYAEKPTDVAPPPAVKPAPEGSPPAPALALPAPTGPVQQRAGEIVSSVRHVPADRRDDALRELVGLGPEGALALILMIETLDDDAVRFAGRALREVRSPLLREPLVTLLKSVRPLVRAEAVSSLALLGLEVDLTWDSSPLVRTASLWAAEVFKSRAAFPRAAALCADPSPDVRRQAIRAVFLIAREHALADQLRDGLVEALRGEAVPAARVEILDALARLRNASAWTAAADELRRDAVEVRIAAARCLAELRSPDSISSLAEALASEVAGPAKVALAEAAGRLRQPMLVEPLIARLSDPDPKVVRASADALAAITGQNHGSDPSRWTAYWEKARR